MSLHVGVEIAVMMTLQVSISVSSINPSNFSLTLFFFDLFGLLSAMVVIAVGEAVNFVVDVAGIFIVSLYSF